MDEKSDESSAKQTIKRKTKKCTKNAIPNALIAMSTNRTSQIIFVRLFDIEFNRSNLVQIDRCVCWVLRIQHLCHDTNHWRTRNLITHGQKHTNQTIHGHIQSILWQHVSCFVRVLSSWINQFYSWSDCRSSLFILNSTSPIQTQVKCSSIITNWCRYRK